jgi:hypothetical protein
MKSQITRRIVGQMEGSDLYSALAEKLPPSDLQSLLLDVYDARARGLDAASLLARTAANRLFAHSTANVRMLNTLDRVALQTAAEFEAIDLSPVCALGASFTLGGTSQKNVLSTIRNAEILGDSTIAMAIECARRRRPARAGRDAAPVRLCASHRVVRLQPFDVPGFTPHFRLFAMVTAGRDTGSLSFELQHLREHLDFYLRLMRALNTEGFHFQSPIVEITDLDASEAALRERGVSREEIRDAVRAHRPGESDRLLARHGIHLPEDIPHLEGALAEIDRAVMQPLRASFPEAQFRFNAARLEGMGYYSRFALRISPMTAHGNRFALIDGGFTDWTARLLSNRKERLLISGLGSEFACKAYLRTAGEEG